jgi:hypothetical protein
MACETVGVAAILVIISQSVFPHQLRSGDIVTDDRGQKWEVIGHPSVHKQGMMHQVRVQKPGQNEPRPGLERREVKRLSCRYPAAKQGAGPARRPAGG